MNPPVMHQAEEPLGFGRGAFLQDELSEPSEKTRLQLRSLVDCASQHRQCTSEITPTTHVFQHDGDVHEAVKNGAVDLSRRMDASGPKLPQNAPDVLLGALPANVQQLILQIHDALCLRPDRTSRTLQNLARFLKVPPLCALVQGLHHPRDPLRPCFTEGSCSEPSPPPQGCLLKQSSPTHHALEKLEGAPSHGLQCREAIASRPSSSSLSVLWPDRCCSRLHLSYSYRNMRLIVTSARDDGLS
mmetsp:Transcript_9706/g.36423  ORF Transcript_9706/g.36423 Transcript_9706/m.36423 type:complete len:244 (+) Transcript_9706:406-1137(+)|eukprot:scaffold29_cov251-Pinguiococcus_pyrenoidosus.AAC.42